MSFYKQLMKRHLIIILLLIGIELTLSSTTHPIKLTSSEIKYDEKNNTIGMICNVFLDDFAPAVSSSLMTSVNTSGLTDDDKKRIEYYFITKYKIKINGNTLPLKFETYKFEHNVLTITFTKQNITLKKGDKLYIENELLFEEFFDLQSNWISIRIPPFLPNYTFESKFDKYSYSHTF